MNTSREAYEVRAKLQSVVELIEQHRATLSLLERERLVLRSRLGAEKRKPSGSTRERRA